MTPRPHVSSPQQAPPSFTRKSSTESNLAANGVGPQPQSKTSSAPSVSEINGVKDLEISSPNDTKSAAGNVASADRHSLSEGSQAVGSNAAVGYIPGTDDSGKTGDLSPSVGTGDTVAAVVPSKRSLAMVTDASNAGDTVLGEAQSIPSEDGKVHDSAAKDEGGNALAKDKSNDEGASDANGNNNVGARKRGRQESPSQIADNQPPIDLGPNSAPNDEMEEGEEPEDGEVFEDEEGSQADDKARKGDDVVMDSGKV
ncbi:hypothetical protein GGI23_007109 [Coemansia sp. RSA 2559]|nr:hypothetical protein GGI23_007109 [Coemansia sp. RSA 2559]